MTEQQRPTSKFDRVIGMLHDLPDVKETRPSTVIGVMPILGDVQTYVVQTYRQGGDYFGFLQMVDAEGRERVIIPAKVMAAIYRQRDSLMDRSTPASRARDRARRERERKRKDRARRQEAWRSRHEAEYCVHDGCAARAWSNGACMTHQSEVK
jgi:hypothetical protein